MSANNPSPVMDKTKHPEQRKKYDSTFKHKLPKLGDEYEVLAPETDSYNCIGHTLGVNDEWVNPVTGPKDNPLAGMDKIYAERGYKRAPNMDTSYKPGKKKVVV